MAVSNNIWNSTNDIVRSAACNTLRAISSSSQVKTGALLPSYFGGASTTAISSHEAIITGANQAGDDSGWSSRELASAILFASIATAGSMLLGPLDKLRGKATGGEGGGGGGPGGSGGNNGGPVGGGKYEHAFASPAKELEETEEKIGVGIATIPRPYEVCIDQELCVVSIGKIL